jgi:hypothetical protein
VFATSPTLVTPALGTPASGVVTNLTGTASININGTVGATTANTGAFTTLSATGVTTVQAGTAAAPAITTSGDTNTGIFFPAADTIAFSEGGAEAMRIDSSGNLGLGVTPSAWTTYKAIQLGATTPFAIDSSGAIGMNYYYDGAYKYFGTNAATLYSTAAGQHRWYTAPSGTAGNAISFTQAMTLDANGRLGIGTSSPTVPLHVVNASTPRIYIGSDASKYAGVVYTAGATFGSVAIRGQGNDTGTVVHVDRDNSQVRFDTSGSERLRIDSSGNVGIGTSSPVVNLQIQKAASDTTIRLSDGTNYWDEKHDTAANGLSFSYNGSERLRITSAGNVGIGTSSPSASAILDAQSTTKGVRMPNMTTTQKNAIASPAAGLMVFDTTLSKLCVYSGAAWETITSI